jgi:hypothetical protein
MPRTSPARTAVHSHNPAQLKFKIKILKLNSNHISATQLTIRLFKIKNEKLNDLEGFSLKISVELWSELLLQSIAVEPEMRKKLCVTITK